MFILETSCVPFCNWERNIGCGGEIKRLVEHLFYRYFSCCVITYERIRVNMTYRHFEKTTRIFCLTSVAMKCTMSRSVFVAVNSNNNFNDNDDDDDNVVDDDVGDDDACWNVNERVKTGVGWETGLSKEISGAATSVTNGISPHGHCRESSKGLLMPHVQSTRVCNPQRAKSFLLLFFEILKLSPYRIAFLLQISTGAL